MKPSIGNTADKKATSHLKPSSIRQQWSQREREIRRQLAVQRQSELLCAVLGIRGPWILGR